MTLKSKFGDLRGSGGLHQDFLEIDFLVVSHRAIRKLLPNLKKLLLA